MFLTIQGEGALLGTPQVFVRLGGCSVGCRFCDTDYRVVNEMTAEDIAIAASQLAIGERFVWLTGGEPTDYDLRHLVSALRSKQMQVALATSGHRRVDADVDFLSVSPHDPAKWLQKSGTQLNLVPSLNGFSLADFEPFLSDIRFDYLFVTPCAGNPKTVQECSDWVKTHAGWRMGVQAHKTWGIS